MRTSRTALKSVWYSRLDDVRRPIPRLNIRTSECCVMLCRPKTVNEHNNLNYVQSTIYPSECFLTSSASVRAQILIILDFDVPIDEPQNAKQ